MDMVELAGLGLRSLEVFSSLKDSVFELNTVF